MPVWQRIQGGRMTIQHTPMPYTIKWDCGYKILIDKDGHQIAKLSSGYLMNTNDEVCDFILRAMNTFDSVEALKARINELEK